MLEAANHQIAAPLYRHNYGRFDSPILYADLTSAQQLELAALVRDVDERIAAGGPQVVHDPQRSPRPQGSAYSDVCAQMVTDIGYVPSFANRAMSEHTHGHQELSAGGGRVQRVRGHEIWQLPDPGRQVELQLLKWLVTNPVAREGLAHFDRNLGGLPRQVARDLLGEPRPRKRGWRKRPPRDSWGHLPQFTPWLPDSDVVAGVPLHRGPDGHVDTWAYRVVPQHLEVLAELIAQRSAHEVELLLAVRRGGRVTFEDEPAGVVLAVDQGRWVRVGEVLLIGSRGLQVVFASDDDLDLVGDLATAAGVDARALAAVLSADGTASLPQALERTRERM